MFVLHTRLTKRYLTTASTCLDYCHSLCFRASRGTNCANYVSQVKQMLDGRRLRGRLPGRLARLRHRLQHRDPRAGRQRGEDAHVTVAVVVAIAINGAAVPAAPASPHQGRPGESARVRTSLRTHEAEARRARCSPSGGPSAGVCDRHEPVQLASPHHDQHG